MDLAGRRGIPLLHNSTLLPRTACPLKHWLIATEGEHTHTHAQTLPLLLNLKDSPPTHFNGLKYLPTVRRERETHTSSRDAGHLQTSGKTTGDLQELTGL